MTTYTADNIPPLADEAATMDRRRRLQEELLMLMLIDSLRREIGANDPNGDALQRAAKEDMSLSADQSVISKELLIIAQRLFGAQLVKEKEGGHVTMPSSSSCVSSDQQLTDDDEDAVAVKKKRKAAGKKKRNRKNKATSKHKKSKLTSWSGAGIIPQIIMMALSSITTLVVTLSLVHHSVGTGEGKAPPALQPTISKSLRQRDLQSSNVEAAAIISSPVTSVEPPPAFSPAVVSLDRHLRINKYKQSDEEALPECFDTPNWKDKHGYGCDWYEVVGEPGCPVFGNWIKEDMGMGVAKDHCCYCGGGSRTLPPTTSQRPSLSPSISASPTESCFDTPYWEDDFGNGCDWYKKNAEPEGYWCRSASDMGPASEHCCYCGGGSLIELEPVCRNTHNWWYHHNYDGNRWCDWYEKYEERGCPIHGTDAGNFGPANKHCCHCGGGTRIFHNIIRRTTSPTLSLSPSTSLSPTTSPTMSLSPSISASPTESCLDTPNWKDREGRGCDYYEKIDEPGCPEYGGNWFKGDMGVANEHCCYCGGGMSAKPIPDSIERTALRDFYLATKGAEWTTDSNWMDDYTSHCHWYGVTCCDDDEDLHGLECKRNDSVTKLVLRNNGLSGTLSSSIGKLTFISILDLSDNDIKGSIPEEIGLLSKLTYLRLSHNAFTGTTPGGLAELKNLQLLQLQSNRITEMGTTSKWKRGVNCAYVVGLQNIQVDDSIYGASAFVADCGVPSAFEQALECEHCTMCCNTNEDCYPQKDTQNEKWGKNKNSGAAAVLFAVTAFLCCTFVLFSYRFRRNRRNASTLMMSIQSTLEEEGEKYALSKIGKDSVYSYFVTDMVLGWLIAFATLGVQVGILALFVQASEARLQDDKADIELTWKCPPFSEVCQNKSDLTATGWAIFVILMITFLAKDFVNGCKLIYHSSRIGQPFWCWLRIRYFLSGFSLFFITVFALYVSTVYNKAIATSNTEIIVNAVIVLFVMDMDEYTFATLEAINDKWTAHAADSEDDAAAGKGDTTEDKKDEIAAQKAMIESQQEELTSLKNQITMLNETMQKIQESLAAQQPSSESIPQCVAAPASESVSVHGDEAASEETRSDVVAETGVVMNEVEVKDEAAFESEEEEKIACQKGQNIAT